MTEAAKRGKYAALHRHLTAIEAPEWATDFATLERILGFRLPNSARIYRPWWANDNSSGHSQAMAWTMAGWKTAAVDLDAETLVFRKAGVDPVVPTISTQIERGTEMDTPPKMADFRRELTGQLEFARAQGAEKVSINAGQLHRAVGGYPQPFNRMPVCCQAMYDEKRGTDVILASPAKGKGASLTISYRTARP